MAAKRLSAPPRNAVATVRRLVVERGLIKPGDKVIAGVSGGPDSTCLLLILAALRRSLRFELHAAYFDHGLRGTRVAQREREFVRALSEALSVPFHSGSGDVRAHARGHKLSVEEAARELRYRFLGRVARNGGASAVAVGHTRDDQAETVLLHLIRGSGLRGLAGMTASSRWPLATRTAAPRLIRPLLGLSRRETERCCRVAGVAPFQDVSNRSLAYVRNRVRLELLPRLRRFNPRIEDALARLAESAAGDADALEQLAGAVLEQGGGGVQIGRKRLELLPGAVRAHAVRQAITKITGDTRGMSERHVRSVLAAAERTGARVDLPRGLRVRVDRASVTIALGAAAAPHALPVRAVTLPVPGSVRLGGWTVRSELIDRPRKLSSQDGGTGLVDAEACGRALRVRRRRPGDRFQPLGMRESKKLQDYFVDAGVPRDERDALPLVVNQRGIAWIAGQRPAEWAKVRGATRKVVRLSATRA